MIQALWQPDYPLLYSTQGFDYCDLLLAPAERFAWQRHLSDIPAKEEGQGARAVCREVTERAEQTLDWWTNHFTDASIMDITLDHLTLGRATLYGALLQGDPAAAAHSHITAAVDGLRRAGQSDYLPRGLLTRAWQLAVCGEGTAAQRVLDEAREIAERGPMPLFLADIHLHRARLFHAAEDYPWQSPAHDLTEARRLIEQHGYGRRLPELEDAEAVIMPRS